MDATKLIAIVLIIAGALGLIYGGFSYTSDTHTAGFAGMEMSIDEKEHVNVPIWFGIGTILLGGVLLVMSKK